MDEIRIGLDFGTHQTKICIQRTPDEGHGIPEYEFFKFFDNIGLLVMLIQTTKKKAYHYPF